MNAATPLPLLPQPSLARWQPLRLGLVELYYYDVEEFWFRDGHLLLRGNNGTGKSKVLSLSLPLLLDANLSSARVEPDGDRHKRMDWNLLMNGRYDRRIGYTWIEFGRRDEFGHAHTLTLGLGLRAIAGRPSVDSWFFMTEQRIGAELWLTSPERTALSRERLSEALGARGQVFETAQAYRRAVDERLFRLGSERYTALVDTLIQLRQPQLSKQPNEERLSAALTEALRPLDRGALEDVAEAMSQLEDLRRELQELELLRKSVAAFGHRYRRYAQMATRRRAKLVRQAQTEFDQASREAHTAQEELETARQAVARQEQAQERCEQELAAGAARLRVLQADPVMRDAHRMAEEREREAQSHRELSAAEARLAHTASRLAQETQGVARRAAESAATRATLAEALHSASQLAAPAGLDDAHATALADAELPDGADRVRADFAAGVMAAARAAEGRRREDIALIRKRVHEAQAAFELRARALDAKALHADAFDAAEAALRERVAELRAAGAQLLSDWRSHCLVLRVLELPQWEDVLGALEVWLETLDGANPARSALERAWQTQEATLAAADARLAAQAEEQRTQRAALNTERQRLERGEDQVPPQPYTRAADVRAGRAGAPLWQLVDFAGQIPAAARAGLEAALEVAGLLDAWVLPSGLLLDARTDDVLLRARPALPVGNTLSDWLVPTIPAVGPAAEVDASVIDAILRSIACADEDPITAEIWISPRGEFRSGPLKGAWRKPQAGYIGHAAREAARQARLAQIDRELGLIDATLAEVTRRSAELSLTRAAARAESDGAPGDDALLRAQAERGAAERSVRETQLRLGESESKLATAEHAYSRARDALAFDAADLRLPTETAGLERVEGALGNYRVSVTELANAIRSHRNALGELAEQRLREAHTREEHAVCAGDRTEKLKAVREVEATVRTLQETVGKQVDELLREIEHTKRAQREADAAYKLAVSALIDASARRGTAEEREAVARRRTEERVQMRKAAIDGLRTFTQETGLFEVALPEIELPDPTVNWTIEVALTLARRAEQELLGLPAEDSDWHRSQQEISREVTDLQTAMAAQGHSAAAELGDYGIVVRIVYRQRAERPDTLQVQLDRDLAERRLILSAQEREVLENHLEKEIAADLQHMMRDTEQRVSAINQELHKRPTSTGVRYRLDWQVLPEDAPESATGLTAARKRLLKTSADAWSPDDRRQVGEFLQSRIAAERARDEQSTLSDSLARALDYRRWHRFRVQRLQDGAWKPLSGPASSGERALGLTVPLFAAASSHYESADPNAPRLVLLDEAFAGVDDEARANCMALIREFDLDFVMTSEREWGCYPDLPGLSICQLARREGVDAVHVSRWTWDGRVRRADDRHPPRFPPPRPGRDDGDV